MPKQTIFLTILTTLILSMICSHTAKAGDDVLHLPLKLALEAPKAKEVLNPDIALYFAGQKTPSHSDEIGTYVSNKKTNSAFKKDEDACNWVLLSALISLQERAVKEGGNTVVDIESFYDKQPYRSATNFECHAGTIMAGVALRGTVVKR